MPKRIIWQINVGDFERDTQALSTAEVGAYFLLCGHYYSQGGLPDDENLIRRIARVPSGAVWNRMLPRLRALFQQPGWKHKRIDRDIAKVGVFSRKMSALAKRRWDGSPVDNRLTATPIRDRRKSLKSHDPPMRPAMLSEGEYKYSPSVVEGDSVESGLPEKQNGSANHHPTRRQRRAEQAWQTALLRQLGREAFADAIDVLAAHPDLIDRCTAAELRAKGAGIQAALLGLRQIMGRPPD